MSLWNQGYRVTLVSSDVIAEGKLKVEKMENEFEWTYVREYSVFVSAIYEKLNSFVAGRIFCIQKETMLLGEFGKDFDGNDIQERISKLGSACVDSSDLIRLLEERGIVAKRMQNNASFNEDGSYVETFYPALHMNEDVAFKVILDNHEFAGICRGMIAIQTNGKGELVKLASSGLSELKKMVRN